MTSFKVHLLLCLLLFCTGLNAQEGKSIRLEKQEVTLYYEDSGSGKPLVFIPGWTMTSRFFEKQKTHFSKSHRFLAMDPRSQGNSEKTMRNNTYEAHARDLAEFLEKLDLNDVVLVGWSSGCITLFEYAMLFGNDRVEQFIFIDETPKWIGDIENEWVYGAFNNYKSSLKGLLNGRDPEGVIDWMLADKTNDADRSWMSKEMLKTPDHAALSLYIDGLISDYTQVLRDLDTKKTSVFLLREAWFQEAKEWLDSEAPQLAKDQMSSHAMFWSEPDRFNKLMEKYLSLR